MPDQHHADRYKQELRFAAFESDAELFVQSLGIKPPAFADDRALTQLKYLAHYLSDPVMACQTIVVEAPYVDRDHMEDHSVFYSRNLFPYKNTCRRVHFFRTHLAATENAIKGLRVAATKQDIDDWRTAAREFAVENYLGFAVLKPLEGTPVGRTVLCTYPELSEETPNYRRVFASAREFDVHLAGVPLVVRGLPFQEQDKAVAACATTALWSALHGARALEDVAPFTPAQITALAARNSLPYGRAMPSEGLSIDQMCQAVQAIGLSPVLRKATDFDTSRGVLFSAARSGVAPVLIVTDGKVWHAVAVTGIGVRVGPADVATGVADAASRLVKLFLHDDRKGPYLRAPIRPLDPANRPDNLDFHAYSLGITVEFDGADGVAEADEVSKPEPDHWVLQHVLVPMHAKIRITFEELRLLALDFVVAEVRTYRDAIGTTGLSPEQRGEPVAELETFIVRSYLYTDELLTDSAGPRDPSLVHRLVHSVTLPRYVGVIRLSSSYYDRVDVLIDTTSTDRNTYAIAVVVHSATHEYSVGLANHLADSFACRPILPT